MVKKLVYILCLCWILSCEAKRPELTAQQVTEKVQEIMKSHATEKTLTPPITKRILNNYLELLDSSKTYFLEPELDQWVHPSDALLNQLIEDFSKSNFQIFDQINDVMVKAIMRRRDLDKHIDYNNLPEHVRSQEFKDMPWAKTKDELIDRLRRIRALQVETGAKLSDDMKNLAMQRIAKRQTKFEDDILTTNQQTKQGLTFSNILKATASALDTHTSYFTPDEATQFMMAIQQRLFGIGAQLRDDINGFTITKLVEGGPAAESKLLKAKDKIVAVDGEPVVGMDINDVVDLIRGEEHTPVTLTIIRTTTQSDGSKTEEKMTFKILRGEVILKETRYKTSYEPYGDGIIGYIKLFSFYQDRHNSSATDLENEINKLKKEHNLLGLIFDLRYNSGGLLSQAVSVTGLFITKGTVVSIKDENGKIQHLRELDNAMVWDGPLVVLVNRMSASASEIVAQTLQDYGRAILVGDDHTYGKGSFQTFTLTTDHNEPVNPQGEYKVTRGRYYTVSGQTPQLNGVQSDIIIPGPLSESEVGERYLKYPLEHDHIKPNFDDDLSDIPLLQRDHVRKLYKFGIQEKVETYEPYLSQLKTNSNYRIAHNSNYQNFLKEIKKKDEEDLENQENFGKNDLQLEEAYSVIKDLLIMMRDKGMPIGLNKRSPSSTSESKKMDKIIQD